LLTLAKKLYELSTAHSFSYISELEFRWLPISENEKSGILEVLISGVWGTVLGSMYSGTLDVTTTRAICSHFGFGFRIQHYLHYVFQVHF